MSGSGDFAANIVGDLVAGADALDDHQIENVQRDGDISAEDFRELAVVLVEGGALPALDVEDADDFVVQSERDGQAALGIFQSDDIARIALHIRADIAAPGGGDVAADAVALAFGHEVDAQCLGGQSGADDQFQLVGFCGPAGGWRNDRSASARA